MVVALGFPRGKHSEDSGFHRMGTKKVRLKVHQSNRCCGAETSLGEDCCPRNVLARSLSKVRDWAGKYSWIVADVALVVACLLLENGSSKARDSDDSPACSCPWKMNDEDSCGWWGSYFDLEDAAVLSNPDTIWNRLVSHPSIFHEFPTCFSHLQDGLTVRGHSRIDPHWEGFQSDLTEKREKEEENSLLTHRHGRRRQIARIKIEAGLG